MVFMKLLAILILLANDAYGKCDGSDGCCKGQCGQAEGDCDWDSDCLPGLICESGGWLATDYCKAGPDTEDFEWLDWGEWDECSVICGGEGTQTRSRECKPPKNGGYPCPSPFEEEPRSCNNGPCPVNGAWSAFGDWTECSQSCGGGDRIRTRSCTNPEPKYGGEDCTGWTQMTETCNDVPCITISIDEMVGDWKADAIDIDPLDVTCSQISDTQVSCVIGTNSVEQTLTLEGAKVTHDRTGREGTYDGIGLITWPKLDYKRAITWTKQDPGTSHGHPTAPPPAACAGGDSCCSEDNKCDVGEGDCDWDTDCLDGLKCGWNNCDSTGEAEWDWNDDCCYKPGKYWSNLVGKLGRK